MNRSERVLQKFGLSNNEIKVYLECLKHDEASPFQLAKITGIPRTTIYDIILALSLKGLVELTQSDGFQKQQTRIKAKNPSELRNILRKRQKELVSLEVDIVDILPELKSSFQRDEANAYIRFYPGIDGAKRVLSSEINNPANAQLYTWDPCISMDAFGISSMNEVVSQEVESLKTMKYKPKELIPLNDWTRHVYSYQFARNPDYLRLKDVRFLDSPIFDLHQQITIVANTVRILCSEGDEIWGLVINSKNTANTFKSIFELMWQQASPLTEQELRKWGRSEFYDAENSRKS